MRFADATAGSRRGPLAWCAAGILLGVVAAVPASAQEGAPTRVRLFANGTAATSSIDYAESLGYRQFGAQSSFDARYSAGPTAGFELGGQLRLWQNLGVALSFARLDRKGTAEIRTSLPLPVALGGSAEVSAAGGGFPVEEQAVHVDLVYSRRVATLEIGAFAGVTRTRVVAGVLGDLNTSISFSPERPPSVVAAPVPRTLSDSAIGFNVGGGVDVVLGTFGLGAQLRYSRSTVSLLGDAEGRLAPRSLEIETGGLQIAGGLRVFF